VNPAATKEALKQAQKEAVSSAQRIFRRVSPHGGMPAVTLDDEVAPVIFGPGGQGAKK
jgi:hypothetical protein